MKSVVSSVSLLVAVLHLVGIINPNSVEAKAIIPTPEIAGLNSSDRDDALQAQAVTIPHLNALDQGKVDEAVPFIEQTWEKQYEDYFQVNFSDRSMTVQNIADTLNRVAIETGKKPALLYIVPRTEQLELVLITPDGQPIHRRVVEANQQALLEQTKELVSSVVHPIYRNTSRYLPAAQQLYQWMLAPLEAELEAQGIDTLLLCVGPGLRTLPFAALHDGEQFLVEKYSFSRIPAFKLTSTIYADLRKAEVLAMGASEFRNLEPLPAVPAELSTITKYLWQGKSFLNQAFTVPNLQAQRRQQSYKIIHLATHASFQSGSPSNSYVQFWDRKLTLDQMSQLSWSYPPIELLVLSACKTAIGDEDAELGFAGLAVQANVKSAIASLWNVSDEGTLGLMTQFYRDLKTAPTKGEALRQAQVAMIKGQVRLEGGQLHTSRGPIALPPAMANVSNENLSHPYYWAAFTLVGSPW
ncbi:MAG: CHAT domain-containing protein [Coleofasciculus sp. S288]|nr:CHAT domain-containing protein [Coleofasciculus sp. S288]